MNTQTKTIYSKVCGLTRAEDSSLCAGLGVSFTGFIFAPKSPRCISLEQAASLPTGACKRVGVFVGEDPAHIEHAVAIAKLDYLQLHGGESPEVCNALGPERVIKTLWPSAMSPAELERALDLFAPVCAFFLFDAGAIGGGSGASLDFAALASLRPPRPWLLAGGIGPANIRQALSVCRPDGVDMNSALEHAPGLKDHAQVRAAVKILNYTE